MLIETSGLEYDDRLRKEALSIVRLGHSLRIVALEYANEAGNRLTYGSVPVTTFGLSSRRWFARTRGVAVKLLESYVRFAIPLLRGRTDLVWFHNLNFGLFVPFLVFCRWLGLTRTLIWDQHEMPFDWMLHNRLVTNTLTFLMNCCDAVIVASADRKVFLQDTMRRRLHVPIVALENYPDNEFAQMPPSTLDDETVSWLGDVPFLLAQGGANPNRHLEELVEAVISDGHWKLAVVGPYKQAQVDRLMQKFGPVLSERVRFTGLVPQMAIGPFVDSALASVVLYDQGSINLRYCAPNRLYQALCRGVPVLVGTNPPLRRIIETYGCGVVVETMSAEGIRRGLADLAANNSFLRANARQCLDVFRWENQDSAIADLLNALVI